MGVTGGRGIAGAGPGRDLLYGSREVPAPYRRTGDLGPHEPCPRTPRVRIIESVESTPDWEAREEQRCSERRALAGHGLDMGDLASMCERQCRKACNLRSAAEGLEETGSNGRARRYRKRGSPKPAAETKALETDPSPVRLWSAADSEGHSEGYRTAYEQPLESEEIARPPTSAIRPQNPAWSMTPRRWRGPPEPERRLWPGTRSQRGIAWATHPWQRSPRRQEPWDILPHRQVPKDGDGRHRAAPRPPGQREGRSRGGCRGDPG